MRSDRSTTPDVVFRRAHGVRGRNRGRRRASGRGHRSPAYNLRGDGAAGSAEETAATIRGFVDAGAERIYLQVLDLSDLDHLDFIAGEVVPLLA
jgi:hypothetical protein